MQDPAGHQAVGDQSHRRGLQQPPLVMAGLGPRVREEHPHPGERGRGQRVFEHIHTVTSDQPDIGDAVPVERAEQLAQTLLVDLHGDDVEVGLLQRHGRRRGPGAAPDLQDQRGVAAEPGRAVQHRRPAVGVAGLGAQPRPQPFPGLLLAAGQGGAPGPEAGDATHVVGAGGVRAGCCAAFRGDGLPGVLALGIHRSIVAHPDRCTRIAGQIDTQQLSLRRSGRETLLIGVSWGCDDVM